LDAFARTLRFKFGYACWHEMAERAAERMEHHGLKSDHIALLIAVGVVREWVKTGRQEITRADLEAVDLPPHIRAAVLGVVAAAR
jgi:hypothetical protein